MQSDEITALRLANIATALETATDDIDHLTMQVVRGEVTPEHAASVINDMMANLNALTK
jgi:hypothetical protein